MSFVYSACECICECSVRVRVSAGWSARSYLRLRESQVGAELCPLREGQVLAALEPALQLLYLQAGVNGARLPHFLPLRVDPTQNAVLYGLF
jgi:hypothetical protein